jgi:NurA domain.
MPFENEYASYRPLWRVLSNPTVKGFIDRLYKRKYDREAEERKLTRVTAEALPTSNWIPKNIIAIDGGVQSVPVENGYPGAEVGYITVASVLIKLNMIKELEKDAIIDPKEFRKTEDPSSIDTVIPGQNVLLDEHTSPRVSMRKALYDTFKRTRISSDGESLLDTYEALLQSKIADAGTSESSAKDPIEGYEDQYLHYALGEYTDEFSGQTLYSTDALRIHELFDPNRSTGEMFGQIMSVMEKLWLIHILRFFEQGKMLSLLRDTAFFVDGPLAVFSTSAWLAPQIRKELARINQLQKKSNGTDMVILGIEKSGTFKNHLTDLDTESDGATGRIPIRTAFLLDDAYIKKNIIFSPSPKPYGQDTYFGRKSFYKTKTGYLLVPVLATYDDHQASLETAEPDQFPRLGDVAALLDEMVSNRYPDSVSPLISAHAEAAIPLSLGTKIFEEIAREIRNKNAC